MGAAVGHAQVVPSQPGRSKSGLRVAGLGVAIGPIVGGLLLEHFTWHAIFWVNPPIAVAVIVAVVMFVPESADQTKPRLDLIGALLSGLGLVALVVTIIELPEVGIDAFTIGAALCAVVFLVGFTYNR